MKAKILWTLIVIYGGLDEGTTPRIVSMIYDKPTQEACEATARETMARERQGTAVHAYCAYEPKAR